MSPITFNFTYFFFERDKGKGLMRVGAYDRLTES
ncbi:hypothetical protein ANTHELSMS3_04984 (plasmid) [Antarctobacter heliothermus]|uniref:Uncharacterized protein n=1 Tax=Antarctobacter heliothermus TaxID=74033 RepID=A0A222EB50_9RHOB|nr:hypothetical protein ANTHELSMS3_04984 [Antarctobacter heliothermus]